MNIVKVYQDEQSPLKRKAIAEQAYLLYINEFLTIKCFSDYYGTAIATASEILREGKHWNSLPKIEAIEAMNLIEGIQHELATDNDQGKNDSETIKGVYKRATGKERAAIDNVFISLTGWTLESLIKMY